MPSGTHITAGYGCYSRNDCHLDIAVYALVEDAGHSEGLCGNYNGNKDDDLIPKGKSTADDNSEPIELSKSYM